MAGVDGGVMMESRTNFSLVKGERTCQVRTICWSELYPPSVCFEKLPWPANLRAALSLGQMPRIQSIIMR